MEHNVKIDHNEIGWESMGWFIRLKTGQVTESCEHANVFHTMQGVPQLAKQC
jgi:hypothetical protein